MRLLEHNADDTFSLTEFVGNDIPPYAILSHTWGLDSDEVTFEDLVEGTGKSKGGYDKIRFCGEQAKHDGLQYFWVDTCAIDKSSSAELSEAINSMFQWYRSAKRCYVSLADVVKHGHDGNEIHSQLRKSKWFTRGWTLQELIAPSSVEFFSREWEWLGDKNSLEAQLHEITGIPIRALQGSPLTDFSVDERMSWAEKRSTKREEDKAYSLLGIFGVHMPLIYSEGEQNAYRRLKEEIDKSSMLSLGIQVTESLVRFYVSSKDQDAGVARTTANLESVLSVFKSLSSTLQHRTFRPDEQDLVERIGLCVRQCEDLIQELKEEFEKFDEDSVGGFKSRNKTDGRRVKYPFRQSTLQKLDEDINEIRHTISLALDVLQLRDQKTIQNDIAEVKSLVEVVRSTQISREIRNWLQAPDATINHQAACTKRHPGTGLWFVKGSIFTDWLIQDNSFLWLNGFAGCGKSVLCSTAIQFAFRHKQSDRGTGIAFFYFTFNDESKQDESAMLRALLLQLSSQRPDLQTELAQLYSSYSTTAPQPTVLIAHLQHLIQKFDHVYILLDALDESPRPHKRDRVLHAIKEMRKWLLPGLHLLVTSRDEPDIRKSLDPQKAEDVIMKNTEVNQDISDFISGQLATNSDLLEWRVYHDYIRQVLSERAQGVFRWVECQLMSLKDCPQNEYYLDQCLQSLPQTLDETYERILCSINKAYIEDVRRILTLLCFSSRPLTVYELGDAVAVDLREPAHINFKRRLCNTDDFRKLCPGLIDVDARVNIDFDQDNETQRTVPTLRIAHFSVQEYLESDRIKEQKARAFALESGLAHAEISRICLVYLLEPGLPAGAFDQAKLVEFPLAHFAASFWYHHYKTLDSTEPKLDQLILALFQQSQENFCTWLKLHDPDKPRIREVDFSRDSAHLPAPVYYASLLGLYRVVHELIKVCSHHPDQRRDLVNARGGSYHTPLRAASSGGHEKVVQMLINAGADVNAQDKNGSTALEAASLRGREKVVQMLIDAGADVNAHDGFSDTALQAASSRGHEKVVQMLINTGADVNAHDGFSDTALQAASSEGHEKVVQMLINAGADVNAQDEYHNTALQAASFGGHEKVVQMLINAGADVNAQDEYHNTALYIASSEGHEKVVQMLIDAGADVNAQSGEYGTALQAVLSEGTVALEEDIWEADGNTLGGHYNSTLQITLPEDYHEVAQMLVDAGADVAAARLWWSSRKGT